MVDTAITGMFGRNTNAQSLSDTKTDKSNVFADVMAKSISSLLPISKQYKKGVGQIKGSKTSIDSVFVKMI